MREFLISAYEWLICLSEAAVVFLLFKSKFKCEKPKLSLALAGLPILATVTFVSNMFSMPWVLLAILAGSLHLLYAFVCFSASPSMKCIWAPVPFIIFCTSNFVYLILFYVIFQQGEASMIPGNTVRIVGQLIYATINFAILFPLTKIRSNDGELPSFLRAGSVVLALIGIAVSMFCFSELVAPETENTGASIWILGSAVLTLSAALLLLSGYISRLYSKHLEMQKDLQKSKLESEHVRQVSAMYDYVRGWRHDVKDMVSTLSSLASRGEYDSMKGYLRELNGAAEETKLLISTGNPALDATVSAKLMLADKNGATVDHTIAIPENMEIESTDICSIVLNLMDNAIEAVSALPPGERRIDLEIIEKGGMLAVRVQNPCNGEYKFDGNTLATTKPNSSIHGIGLERISRIVAGHQGFFKIEPKEHSFEVNVLLPLTKEGVK